MAELGPRNTPDIYPPKKPLRVKLMRLLHEYCAENGSDTPDFVLAQYLMDSLVAFDRAVSLRERWYNRSPGNNETRICQATFSIENGLGDVCPRCWLPKDSSTHILLLCEFEKE